MIWFERAVKITGPAAAIEAFGKALERTGEAFVDFGPAYRWAAIVRIRLATVGDAADGGGDLDGLSDALQHSISEEEYFQEIERQESYRDWAEQRYAAARGLA